MKTQILLELQEPPEDEQLFVAFVHPDRNEVEADRAQSADNALVICRQDWEDLNSPTEITVTIEPGNTIN